MKKIAEYFNAIVPSLRWVSVGVSLLAMLANAAAIWRGYNSGDIASVGLSSFSFGVLFISSVFMLTMPGVFRRIAEAEREQVAAQIDKIFRDHMAEIAAKHPDLNISVGRIQ